MFKKRKEVIVNPFAEPEVIDRRVEKFKYCKVCNVKLEDLKSEEVICINCGTKFRFRNVDNI